MPSIEVNGVALNYIDTGTGNDTIVFSHGLLMRGAMFAEQIAHFSSRYRCIAYDHRGQAGSAVTESGYDMDTLTEDAAALIGALDAGPCHFVGLSMGGFVGMRLAIRRPELLKSLALLDTSADAEPEENKPKYRTLNFVARWFGLRVVVGRVMPILFGQTFLTDPARAEDRTIWRNHICDHDRKGITRAVTGVIEREGVYDQLGKISLPTLVVVGDEDVATVPAKSRRIVGAVAGAELKVVQGAGHSSPVEQPDAVSAEIEQFLGGLK